VDLHAGGWDLLAIGDDVTVRQDASLRLVELSDGHLVVGPVTLDDGATVDVRAGVSGHAGLGRGAFLSALSWLEPGSRVPEDERYDGVPARPAGPAPALPLVPAGAHTMGPVAHGLATILLRFARGTWHWYLAFAALALPVIAAFDVDAEHVIAWYLEPPWEAGPVLALAAIVALGVPLATWAGAVELRFLGRVRPGVLGRWSLGYLRVLAKADAVRSAGRLLSGTLFWPGWLRLAGMRVGARCEISTIIDVLPECVEVGEETFFADGVYLGGPRVTRGAVEVGTTRLGRNTFVGNHAVIPAGTHLPDDVLLGVCTVADPSAMRRGTSWFGLPAFELPRREIVSLDRNLTHEPGPLRYATRLAWELARFILPVPPVLVLCAWLQVAGRAWTVGASTPAALLGLPAATLAVPVAFAALVVALKWMLLGRVRPGQHPLWSCWCSRWDFLYVAWGAWLRPFLARLEGTLLLGFVLRAFGVRIGRRVVLGSGFAQVVDPDMLAFEDGATVASMFQAHSFEDRVLKIDRVRVGAGASVGSAAVLFYGARVGARSWVAPHSVVMKHERLVQETRYAGCPTVPRA
jgi:non-ribosomal peptide synthetase-like protein